MMIQQQRPSSSSISQSLSFLSLPHIAVSEPDNPPPPAATPKQQQENPATVNSVAPSSFSTPLVRPPMLTSTSSSLSKRAVNAPRISQMPPRVFEVSEQGSVRLSPSVVHARPTAAMINLPLPTLRIDPAMVAIQRNDQAAASVSRLGDMPAFTADGVHDRDLESDHDSTDDEQPPRQSANTDSDDEDHDIASTAGHRQNSNFSFFDTPLAEKRAQPFWHNTSPLIPALKVTGLSPHLDSTGSANDRPAMYRLKSQSMIDVTSPPKQKEKLINTPAPIPEAQASLEDLAPIRKRRSMPTFNHTSEPPPYPQFDRHAKITPHREDLSEHLPGYTNHIHVVAVMPRKMEFSAPGVQARDRKWRRTLCELEGTVFRIYKCPAGITGNSAITNWWERKVGVGDVSHFQGTQATAVSSLRRPSIPERSPIKIKEEYPSPNLDETPAPVAESSNPRPSITSSRGESVTPSKPRRFTSHFLHPSLSNFTVPTNHNRARSETHPLQQERASLESQGRVRSSTSRSSSAAENATSSTSHSTLSTSPLSSPRSISPTPSSSHKQDVCAIPKPIQPEKSDLIRTYTLQHAESGLGNDYVKRKNVIRVRMEGEQFLLQAPDVPAVVEWIEGLHAATDISLDLDERPMPRGPIFPRRRRRRPRGADAANPRDMAAAARRIR